MDVVRLDNYQQKLYIELAEKQTSAKTKAQRKT